MFKLVGDEYRVRIRIKIYSVQVYIIYCLWKLNSHIEAKCLGKFRKKSDNCAEMLQDISRKYPSQKSRVYLSK